MGHIEADLLADEDSVRIEDRRRLRRLHSRGEDVERSRGVVAPHDEEVSDARRRRRSPLVGRGSRDRELRSDETGRLDRDCVDVSLSIRARLIPRDEVAIRIRGDRGVSRVGGPGDARDGPDRDRVHARHEDPGCAGAAVLPGNEHLAATPRDGRRVCGRADSDIESGAHGPHRADSSASYCPRKAVCALRPDDEEAPWCRCDGGFRPRRRRYGLADRRESEPALDHGSAGVQARAPEIRFLLPNE